MPVARRRSTIWWRSAGRIPSLKNKVESVGGPPLSRVRIGDLGASPLGAATEGMEKVLAKTGLTQRRAIRVRGLVQGVGFRPFVYRLAVRYELGGFVRNETGGVAIEVEGPEAALREFLRELKLAQLPNARVTDISCGPLPPQGRQEFRIERSLDQTSPAPSITPDVATCDECLREILDPAERRHGYAFTTCVHCGPRFAIVAAAPYDRDRTSMAAFPLCGDCRKEFEGPADRRYHAEATACAACGPRLRLLTAAGREIETDRPIEEAGRRLRVGKIVAVKGLGGFHLACDAGNTEAVGELRRRKGRDEKPFAVMVAGLDAARALCEVSPAEAGLLQSPARPIVLLRRAARARVADAVAPGNPFLGVLLPYTPLHLLLLAELQGRPLVLTSGNVSDEPIAFQDPDALERLGAIADFFLTHDRPIQTRCDDSVARIAAGRALILRRSRGYAPASLDLRFPVPSRVLALGGALKNVFALGRGREAILSHHLGDLENYEAWRTYVSSIERFEKLFHFEPQLLAHDLHPDYPSTRYALERCGREGLRRVAVQHHHAHMASCMAENGLEGPAIGVTFDGTGYGIDGTIWGGEFLIGDFRGFRRAAHFGCVPMPGGERAIREPWRMALAYLEDAGEPLDLLEGRIPAGDLEIVGRQLDQNLNAPRTSSCGRVFDGVSSLLGIRDRVSYEGQAAIELESRARESSAQGSYPVDLAREDEGWIVRVAQLISAIAGELRRGVPAPDIARRFHSTLVEIVRRTCLKLREESGLDRVVLSGGVFMNEILLTESSAALGREGFAVYRHRLVPPNDGGICLGQLAVAAGGGGF
jgi:hydrogenase maturation protein HypF